MAKIAAALLVSLLLVPTAVLGDEPLKPRGTVSSDFVDLQCIGLGESNRINESSFLERCGGAKALVEFVVAIDWAYRETNRERVEATFRQSATGTCVFGPCPTPLTGLLAKESIPDFYAQHCCAVGETNFYIALFADGRKEWVYFNHRPIARERLIEACE